MMSNKLLLLLAGLVAWTVSSCSLNKCGGSKDQFLTKMETLVEDVTEADLAYSDPAWENYDDQFRALVEDCYPEYEEELRGRERRRFWGQFVKYYYKRYGAGMARELLAKGSDELGNIKINWEDLPKEEIVDLLETIGDDVESWTEELESWFEGIEVQFD